MSKNPLRYELDTMDEYGFALYERFVPAGTTYPLEEKVKRIRKGGASAEAPPFIAGADGLESQSRSNQR